MTDNDVYITIRRQLLKQLTEAGMAIPVIAGFQSTKQGREGRFLMFFPINEAAHGWQSRSYNIAGRNANHRETQLAEKTLQVQGFGVDDSLTNGDIAALARMIVNSLTFVEALRREGIGVQRASGIRTPFFVNDRGDYEQNPSFDFNVTFHRELRPNTPATSVLNPKIIPV